MWLELALGKRHVSARQITKPYHLPPSSLAFLGGPGWGVGHSRPGQSCGVRFGDLTPAWGVLWDPGACLGVPLDLVFRVGT